MDWGDGRFHAPSFWQKVQLQRVAERFPWALRGALTVYLMKLRREALVLQAKRCVAKVICVVCSGRCMSE